MVSAISGKKQSKRPCTAIPHAASFCRQEVAPAGSQQLRAQDLVPARRCGTEGRTGHQGREGGRDDGNRDGSGNEYKAKDAGENWSGNGDENIDR